MPCSSLPAGNPLATLILPILRQSPQGLSEYDLIQALKRDGADFGIKTDDADLALFRTHFLVMNALYQLQDALLEDGLLLQVSPLAIRLTVVHQEAGTQLSREAEQGALREYYLDLDQLTATTGDEVRALLAGFWRRLEAEDGRCEQALEVLGLEADAPWSEIRRAYRRRAARTHPDRGGDPATFLLIREAYETLRYQVRQQEGG